MPNNVNIEASHEVIDRIERDAIEELGIFLVVHMDPIETQNEEVFKIRTQVDGALKGLDESCSIHDFRVVEGKEQINLIFDMVVPVAYDEKMRRELQAKLAARLRETDYRYRCVITIEHSFVSSKND